MAPEQKRSLVWQIVTVVIMAVSLLAGSFLAVGGRMSEIDRIKENDAKQWPMLQRNEEEHREMKSSSDRRFDELSYNLQRLMESKGVKYIKLDNR